MLQNIITNLLTQRSYRERDYPSWLLFETENNLLIHHLKTMLQKNNESSIYQLNMGGEYLQTKDADDYFDWKEHYDPSSAQRNNNLKMVEKFDASVIGENGENYGNYEDFIQGKCLKDDKVVELLKTKSQDMLNSFLLAKAWLSHELLYHVLSYRLWII
ncbi:unnamed protein product [Didymodactylos carnosus]|uniref:Uncharacterized protein n=1 Tax=Didymodactylos carnosus TaxID=1234261 RepID=A0A8S2T3D6_9BILA|nr:unnamed protein product [Didymodactylos carnosus]CAF4258261.1 unnamed protein product [Didymodactylos carnosus]